MSYLILPPFPDDFGNLVFPFQMLYDTYMSRYYFFKESA